VPGGPRFAITAYDDPESLRFVDAVQAFYVERYGGADRTPVDEFASPRGLFLLGRLPGAGAVCCGGWRRHTARSIAPEDRDTLRPGDAEVKRMWVDPAYRRRGIARALLAELERTAAAAGCTRTVLETGDRQPEAEAFYRVVGYEVVPRFGVYRDEPGCLCLARDLTARADPLA
jgi:ribosomal protein S18 acetylase RimI-like enzyme